MSEQPNKPVILIVRDGWGHNPNTEHDAFNAIKIANTPVSDALAARYPSTLIHTSSADVGLPEGTMGNSEVGHQNIGAGRIVNQESVAITYAARKGEFSQNKKLTQAVENAKLNDKYVHLLGIASTAGVHGLLEHLYACIQLCKDLGHDKVALHLFTDGRDTGPYTGKKFVQDIIDKTKKIGLGTIATISGRYYAMDRDNRWERVKLAFDAMTNADGTNHNSCPINAIQHYYDNPISATQNGDEFVTPTIIAPDAQAAKATRIQNGDSVIFYNYRGDRPREIVKAFTFENEDWAQMPASPDTGKKGFDRGQKLDLTFVTMTAYQEGLPVNVAFPKPPKMKNIFGEFLSDKGLRQFRCAETEKFPHVTFFFNDYREEPFPGETRGMAQSPQVATYDLQPEMSADTVRDYVLEQIAAEDPVDFILVNFANGDMVGHTGSLDAAVKAVEKVDNCVGQIVDAALAKGGKLVITADHGNAEQMFDPTTGSPHTAHTLYDVELIVVAPEAIGKTLRSDGRLADAVPTAIELMGLEAPEEMQGKSLLQ